MKFAISSNVYREERFIEPFINHYKNKVDEILILNSEVPYFNHLEPTTVPDKSQLLAEKCGARVVRGSWTHENDQRNDGLVLLKNYDWVLTLDPDEFYTHEDLERLKQILSTATGNVYVGRMYTYWKSGWRVDPPENHRPVVAVRPIPRVHFTCGRGINDCPMRLPEDLMLHHFSWVRTDHEVLRKITCYGHSKDFNTLKWFDEKWVTWQPGDTNFHPVTPEQYHKTVRVNIPENLKGVYTKLCKSLTQ